MKFGIKKFLITFVFALFFLPFKIAHALEVGSYPSFLGFSLPANPSAIQYANYLFNSLTAIGIIAALCVIAFGGAYWLVDFGRGKFTNEGKNWIKSGVVGLFLLLSAYVFAVTINPKLIDFRLEKLIPIILSGATGGGTTATIPGNSYQEIPIGTLTETLLTRTMDCYAFDQSGNPIDGNKIGTSDISLPTYLDHDRADCLAQLADGAQKKAEIIATLSDELDNLMNQCSCDITDPVTKAITSKCDPVCGGQSGCQTPTVCLGDSSHNSCGPTSGIDYGPCTAYGTCPADPTGEIPLDATCVPDPTGNSGGECYGPPPDCPSGETCDTATKTCLGSNQCGGSCTGPKAGCLVPPPPAPQDCCPTGIKDKIEHGPIDTCATTGALTEPDYKSWGPPSTTPDDSGCVVGTLGGKIAQTQNIIVNSSALQSEVQLAITEWNKSSLPAFHFFGSISVNTSVCNTYCCSTAPNGDCISGTAHVPNNTIIIYNHKIDMQGKIPWNPAASNWWNLYNGIISSEINVDMSNPDFTANGRMILMHELGHSLGLDDSYNKATGKANPGCNGLSIMNDPRAMTAPGTSDITEINKLYAISPATSYVPNPFISALLPSRTLVAVSGCTNSGSPTSKCCTQGGYKGLDEFRCPKVPDDGTPCSGLVGYVEKQVTLDNGKIITVIDQTKWNKLNLIQQATYFKEKIEAVKLTIQKDLNSLNSARSALLSCTEIDTEKSSADIKNIRQETKSTDLAITIKKTFKDPQTNQVVDSSAYCNGFNYNNSSCLLKCQNACPDSTPQVLACYGTCEKCDATGPPADYYACVGRQKTCITNCYNRRSCIYSGKTMPCASSNDACNPGNPGSQTSCNPAGGSGKSCGDAGGSGKSCSDAGGSGNSCSPCTDAHYGCLSDNPGHGGSPAGWPGACGGTGVAPNGWGCTSPAECVNNECMHPGVPCNNASEQCIGNKCTIPAATCDTGAGEQCINNKCTIPAATCDTASGEQCIEGKCTIPASEPCRGLGEECNPADGKCEVPAKPCTATGETCDPNSLICKNTAGVCPQNFSTCISSCQSDCSALCVKQDPNQCSDQFKLCETMCIGTPDGSATSNDGNSQCVLNNEDKCLIDPQFFQYCGSLVNDPGNLKNCISTSYLCKYGSNEYAGYSDCLNNSSGSNYSASFLFENPDSQKCPDAYEPPPAGSICSSSTSPNAPCQGLCPETTKCNAGSICPYCPCDQITNPTDQTKPLTINFEIPNAYKTTLVGNQGYTTVPQTVLEHEMTGPQCSNFAYNGDPLTFYCLTTAVQGTPISGKDIKVGLESEIPVGQAVDDARNWASVLINYETRIDQDLGRVLTYAKKMGDVINTPQGGYCTCSAINNAELPICKTRCNYLDSRGSTPCSCTFVPCQGKPCSQLISDSVPLWNFYKQLKIDAMNFSINTIEDHRSDIMKELTYSRQAMDQCSQRSTMMGADQVQTFSCTKASLHTATALFQAKHCYGILDGVGQGLDQTDNWFCAEKNLK